MLQGSTKTTFPWSDLKKLGHFRFGVCPSDRPAPIIVVPFSITYGWVSAVTGTIGDCGEVGDSGVVAVAHVACSLRLAATHAQKPKFCTPKIRSSSSCSGPLSPTWTCTSSRSCVGDYSRTGPNPANPRSCSSRPTSRPGANHAQSTRRQAGSKSEPLRAVGAATATPDGTCPGRTSCSGPSDRTGDYLSISDIMPLSHRAIKRGPRIRLEIRHRLPTATTACHAIEKICIRFDDQSWIFFHMQLKEREIRQYLYIVMKFRHKFLRT